MKRNLALFILFLVQIARAQDVMVEPYHVNRLFYGIGTTKLMITNEFCLETMGNRYLNFPYKERTIQAYGPTLGFYIGDDASFKNNQLPNSLSFSGFVTDSSAQRFERLPLHQLYIRVQKTEQEKAAWQKVVLRKYQKENYPYVFSVEHLIPGGQLFIALAGQDLKPVLRFKIIRLQDPVKPYIAMYMTDTNTRSAFSNFVARNLKSNLDKSKSIDEFYQYWPNKYSASFVNTPVSANTHMALYFRKPNPSFEDSSMEYKFEEKGVSEGNWYKTGHRIFITGFRPGHYYVLTVRYIHQPNAIQTYSFWVPSSNHNIFGWKELVLILTAIGIMILVFSFWLMLEKKKKKLLSLRLRSLRSELNPHFVFNALASLQGLINKGDKELANQYISSFSKLMRDTLRATEIESQALAVDLKTLEHYLELEQLRYAFQYKIDIDPSIPLTEINVPPLLMQPLIENAVKHGVANLGAEGIIVLTVQKKEKNIILCVRDNGKKPFGKGGENKGHGLALTRERIDVLNHLMKGRSIKMEFGNNIETGMFALIEFKNWCV